MTAPEQKFEAMYAAHEGAVVAYCLRRLDRQAALDCAAETFLVAWRRIDDVPTGDDALPWLFRVAHNVIGNHYRYRNVRRRRTVPIDRIDPAAAADPEGPETVVVRRETDREVLDAVHRLRPIDREVLLLSAWEGLSHAQIGELVGCSAHAVDQRVHRAVRRLGRELAARRHGRRSRRGVRSAKSLGVSDVDA